MNNVNKGGVRKKSLLTIRVYRDFFLRKKIRVLVHMLLAVLHTLYTNADGQRMYQNIAHAETKNFCSTSGFQILVHLPQCQ